MSLIDLFYRCPLCGHDPLEGALDAARCPGCGSGFSRGDGGTRIRVTDRKGGEAHFPPHLLSEALIRLGGAAAGPRALEESLPYQGAVHLRTAVREEPCRYEGELLGFVERFGEPRPGSLGLTSDRLEFTPEGAGGSESAPETWWLSDVRAVQASSDSIQLATVGGALLDFRFLDDSCRRWEDLVRRAIRELWRREGRGEVLEFQPRISAR